jgi:hypothetical protein
MNKILMYIFILAFSLVIYTSGTAFSQEQGFDKFGFSVAREHYALRDELMTPMIYSNPETSLGVVYYGMTTHERHVVMYRYTNGTIRSSTSREMSFIRHYFEYGYHRYIASFLRNSGRLFLGLSTNNFITTREGSLNMKAFGVTSSEFTAGEYLLSLNLSLLCELAVLRDYVVQVQSSFPAIAYIARPQYSISQDWSFGGGRLEFIDKYFFNRTTASVGIPIYGPLEAECNYSFSYYSIHEPMKVQSLIHTVGLGMIYAL